VLALLVSFVALTPQDSYVDRFAAALAALDAGRHGEAVVGFRSAGELAPDAHVWRVHAAAALALDGELDAARLEAAAALRRGYPPSDLAAIDRGLVQGDDVDVDLAPVDVTVVLRVALEHVAGWRPRVDLRDGLAIVGTRAIDLATGDLIAERLPLEQRVVARFKNAGGEWEEWREPKQPGWWKHTDGRILEEPALGQGSVVVPLPHGVRGLWGTSKVRGLRAGLWVRGDGVGGPARSLAGADISWSDPAWSFAPPRDGASLVVDADTLTIRERARELWSDPTLVLDAGERFRIGEILGTPLKRNDVVQRFPGLHETIVTRSVGPLDPDYDRAPMVVVNARAGAVVKEIFPPPTGIGSVDLSRAVFAPGARLLLVSNASGSTLEAISTETWGIVWREPEQSRNGDGRRISVRRDRVYSWDRHPSQADVHDLETGALLFDGEKRQLTSIDGSDDGRWVVASSWGATLLLDGPDLAPLLELWVEYDPDLPPLLTAVAVDGTFLAPPERIETAHVLLEGGFVRAAAVAPWLWDPLHVRTMRLDDDRAARVVPVTR